MYGRKLCWSSFILWASTSNVLLFYESKKWANMLQYVENIKVSELVVKIVNETTWCARADATKALSIGYSSLQKALQVID
ncbi:hypothetical protein TNCT_457351 [Trichonephila clavata]|uniref:Uncharacterized protein n=1 Tax=Trichonephila clavata TaxID=2740835 RepID=A0A8X6L9X0_TRICU|nr:hypothetical protein TNCT_457351 [Trichonephila clavata]